MILEGAIGDAYGAGFEFADFKKIQLKNNITNYENHPLYNELKGNYTDDTQMTLALAELILSDSDWTELNIANSFVNSFQRNPRKGYAKRFYSFLTEIKNGQEFLEKIQNTSTRNGAAMRSYILGVFPTEEEVLTKNTLQAKLTHNSEEGILSANAIALANHFFIYEKGQKNDLLTYLNDFQKANWKGKWQGNVSMSGIASVEAVLSLLVSDLNLKERLQMAINFGGDVDTVASLVLAISSQDKSITNNLPRFLYDELENETFGKDYLIILDKKIASKITQYKLVK
ncbi:ADP-ribosylglycohydrolase family protein [Aureivirga marina]|uniref:ADP-ribosylglycohydrolase family protein n=1 Tax=Aureivirga marina TaxID=1182451 RepID=UPI0018CA36B3|nr:ADP-ribosylglycohydrolase family protein [Aureivirga marina]